MDLMIIGDPHASPNYDNDRFSALGEYIAQEKPEIIVCLGDFADLPSLSSYDRGTKGFEGRRYCNDVASVIDAQEKMFAPIKDLNRMLLKKKLKQYKPKLYMTLGNHENRIERATDNSAELDGTISINDLQYKKFGWKCTPFKDCLTIKGISFSHYFTTGAMGRPISGINIGNSMINKLHCSAVQGHSHLISHQESTKPDGQKIFGLSAGCYSHPNYSENWCRDTEYQWWRGIITLEGLDGEGYYDAIHSVTQRAILR